MPRLVSKLLVLLSVAIAGLAGCGGCGGATSTGGGPGPTQTPGPHPGPSAPVFDVHEWGLLDVNARGARLVTGPASTVREEGPRRKPVLYFHLSPGSPLHDARVVVTVPTGRLLERFPLGELPVGARSITWSGLHVRPENCPVTTVPSPTSNACRTEDEECEATELRTYQTSDSHCIDVGGASYNHLFYRGGGPPPPLPFDVTVQGDQVSITHARAADLVGPILYVHNASGAVTVSIIAPPAMGQAVMAAPPTGSDVAAAQQALRAAMQQVGLTTEEVAAFNRAWDTEFFGRPVAREISSRRGGLPQDYLLYVLPASLLDGAARVEITPAPRALRRFMLVRVSV